MEYEEGKKIGQEIIDFYAEAFNLDEKKAKRELSNLGLELRKEDVCRISFFCGISFLGIALMIMLLSLPDHLLMKDTLEESTMKEFMASLYSFRFIFVMILAVAGSGLVFQVMHHHRINYIKIFNIDVKHKISHIKLFRVSLLFNVTHLYYR